MPGQWTSIETNFPTFTGNEKVEDKLTALHNYMQILTQQLKYNLSNLGAENWNTSALRQLTKDTSDEVAAAIASELESIAKRYEQLNTSLFSLDGKVTGAEGRIAELDGKVTGAEGRIAELDGKVESAQKAISKLGEDINGEGGLDERMETAEGAVEDLRVKSNELAQATEELKGAVAVAESSVTIGGEGKELRLVGRIYINGILFEPQENTEQEGTE